MQRRGDACKPLLGCSRRPNYGGAVRRSKPANASRPGVCEKIRRPILLSFYILKKEERTTSAPPLGGLRPPGSNPDATLTLRIPSHPASPRLATLARNGVRFARQITGHWGTRAAPPKPPWQVFKAPWEGPVFLELLLRNSGSPYERKCRPLDHRRSSGGSVSLTTCSISRCP